MCTSCACLAYSCNMNINFQNKFGHRDDSRERRVDATDFGIQFQQTGVRTTVPPAARSRNSGDQVFYLGGSEPAHQTQQQQPSRVRSGRPNWQSQLGTLNLDSDSESEEKYVQFPSKKGRESVRSQRGNDRLAGSAVHSPLPVNTAVARSPPRSGNGKMSTPASATTSYVSLGAADSDDEDLNPFHSSHGVRS